MLRMSAWYFYYLVYVDFTTFFFTGLGTEMVEDMDIDGMFLLLGLYAHIFYWFWELKW